MNGFLVHGKQAVSPDNLETTKDKSQYKAAGKIHEEERDVSKYLKKNHLTVIMAGFERQTEAEKFMPVRQIGYDGQSYRAQLLDTLEIYRPFVSDYEMKNLFEVAFPEPEQVKWFKSDFRYVADYFVQMRLTNDYKPSPDTIEHVDAVLKLMSVLTGDRRFEDAIPEISQVKGGVTMESILNRVENKGMKKGIAIGEKRGEKRGELKGKISVYYNDMGLTPDEIAQKTGQSKDVILEVIKNLTKQEN